MGKVNFVEILFQCFMNLNRQLVAVIVSLSEILTIDYERHETK